MANTQTPGSWLFSSSSTMPTGAHSAVPQKINVPNKAGVSSGSKSSGFIGNISNKLLNVEFIGIMFLALLIFPIVINNLSSVTEYYPDVEKTELFLDNGYSLGEHYGCYDENNVRIACDLPLEYNFIEVGSQVVDAIVDFFGDGQDLYMGIESFVYGLKEFFDDGATFDTTRLIKGVTNIDDAKYYFNYEMTGSERVFYRDVWYPNNINKALYWTYAELIIL